MTKSPSQTTKQKLSKLPTLILVLAAIFIAFLVYQRWLEKPWTRDGQVRADIIMIAPRVSGYIVEVAVEDNQFVHKGDLLFRVDPSSYQLAVEKAEVQLKQARENVAALEASVSAAASMVQQSEAGVTAALASIKQKEAALTNARSESSRANRLAEEKAGSVENAEKSSAKLKEIQASVETAYAALSQAEAALASSRANLQQAKATLGEPGDANVRIREASVQLAQARLNLEWTTISAPADGFITNLDINPGDFGVAGTPITAFVDSASFRVYGYFQETKLKHIKPGDHASVTLMSHPDRVLAGVVNSIGYAINPPGVAATEGVSYLVPQVQPTFDWIRLPQRIPVRIHLETVPDDLQLISGMTASVAIRPSE